MHHGAGRATIVYPVVWKLRPRRLPRVGHVQRRHESSQHKGGRVIFSGIQPTGVPHLGNYLGALQQWKKLQDGAHPSTKIYYSVVDLHAITLSQNAGQLRAWKREMMAALIALGLHPERCTLFYQSAVPEHAELMWILSCKASVGHLSRMTQWKVGVASASCRPSTADPWKSKLSLSEDSSITEAGDAKNRLRLGLFSYPVLQAADILLYRSVLLVAISAI